MEGRDGNERILHWDSTPNLIFNLSKNDCAKAKNINECLPYEEKTRKEIFKTIEK